MFDAFDAKCGIFSNFTPHLRMSNLLFFVPTIMAPHRSPIPDEKQFKSNLLASGESSPLLGHPEWIQHLSAVPGQPAVHQPWYSVL